jgi:hypothetical protein
MSRGRRLRKPPPSQYSKRCIIKRDDSCRELTHDQDINCDARLNAGRLVLRKYSDIISLRVLAIRDLAPRNFHGSLLAYRLLEVSCVAIRQDEPHRNCAASFANNQQHQTYLAEQPINCEADSDETVLSELDLA